MMSNKKMLQARVLILQDLNDPRRILAKDLKTGRISTAKCHPGDQFEFKTGALLACERVLTPVKLWSGIAICVQTRSKLLTEGKLYHVKDGMLRFDDGSHSPCDGNETDFETFNAGFKSEFIEYKGESLA